MIQHVQHVRSAGEYSSQRSYSSHRKVQGISFHFHRNYSLISFKRIIFNVSQIDISGSTLTFPKLWHFGQKKMHELE